MIIAVTYDNGMINQHFGKTQYMKIYETDESGEIQRFTLKVWASTATTESQATSRKSV